MLVRRAKKEDIPALNSLLRQVLDVHHNGRPDLFKGGVKKYTDDQLVSILQDDDSPIFVAEDEGVVCGEVFCEIKCVADDNVLKDCKTLFIEDVCVDASARGKKVGTALFDFVKQYAKEIGCYNMSLNVWAFNEGAKKFYDKVGLKPQKTVMEYILS